MPLRPAVTAKLRDLCERCLARAAESLGGMLGCPVRLRMVGMDSLPPERLPELAADRNGRNLVALQFEITGEESGYLLIVFPVSTVHQLLRRLLPGSPTSSALSPLESSAVHEVGNMLASSFLSELGGLMGRRILHSPPRCQFEDTAQLIRDLCGRLRQAGAAVVMMHARFEDPADHIEGQFFLFPETESVARLTRLAEG